jgi:hypothetical protein
MNNTQRKLMIITTVQTMHNRMIYLKSQNREKDCYSLVQEWMQQNDENNQPIPIVTITEFV